MNYTNLITQPQTHIIARGRDTLLLQDAHGRHSFINLREAAAYDLFSETFKFGIGKIPDSATERLEPLYQSGELIGFHLGRLLALFDDNLPFSSLAKRCTTHLATPLRYREKCGASASWKTLLSVVSLDAVETSY